MNPDKLKIGQFYLLHTKGLVYTGNSVEIIQYDKPVAVDLAAGEVRDFSAISHSGFVGEQLHSFLFVSPALYGIWLDPVQVRDQIYSIDEQFMGYVKLFSNYKD